jgi:dihydroorotase
MKTLIKNARIIDSKSEFHLKKMDILVEDGSILEIGTQILVDAEMIVEDSDLHVSIAWTDMHANFCDPGFEHKEDIQSGCKAALAGGFANVLTMPLTLPITHNKAQIEYQKNRAQNTGVNLLPAGTITFDATGVDLSEMYDMYLSGAIAFTDDKNTLTNPDVMRRALYYSKQFNGLVISVPNDKKITRDGQMNEGIMSTQLGLKGMPTLAEDLLVVRDLYLAEYCEAPIHFSCVSSAHAIDLIRKAKAKGQAVTCDVAFYSLCLNDSLLEEFDTNYKLSPPLRTEENRMALIKGLIDGTIDAIVSDHTPQNIEEKDCEFDHAAFGMAGIETVFSALNHFIGSDVNIETLIEKLSYGPNEILKIQSPSISKGSKNVKLTCFSPSKKVVYSRLKSKSENNPFLNQELKGCVIEVI